MADLHNTKTKSKTKQTYNRALADIWRLFNCQAGWTTVNKSAQ